MDLAIHDIDIVRYLVDKEIESVHSSKSVVKGQVESSAHIILNFTGGIHAHCEVSWLTPMKVREIILVCTKAYIVGNFWSQEIKSFSSDYSDKDINLFNLEAKVSEEYIPVKKEEPLVLEIRDHLLSVVKDKEPLVCGLDGMIAVALARRALNC